MPTAVISDLHLGKAAHQDLLRREDMRALLWERIAPADRLILLGDTIELRESPISAALEVAQPFFEELGRAFAGKPVVLVPGNHDYQLTAPLLDEHRMNGREPLAVDARLAAPGHGALGRIASWARPAEIELSYPGVFLREDVFAMHGHYMDWHGTVPTLERIAIGVAERLVGHGRAGRDRMAPDDYEAALAPVYNLAYSLAQASSADRQLAGGGRSVDAWERLNGAGGGMRARAETTIAAAAIPLAVGALNRLGLGPLGSDLSALELRRAGLRSIATAVAALGVDARYVIFGHTHRSGPWPGDGDGWALPGGGRLTNSGSWIHEPAFLGSAPEESPYFPSVVVWVDDEPGAPPRLERLLGELPAGLRLSRT
jgi:predicted phosphodiesterase